jgi:RimJ/RimL family protein N-acetyltransferase
MPNHDWIIREATAADADAIWRYLGALAAERLPTLTLRDVPPTLEKVTASLLELTASPNSVHLLATQGDDLIGGLDFSGYRKPQLAHGGELGMSVAKSYRNQGIGSALLRALFAWAPERGVSRLELGVFSNNPDAIRLYERQGFEREGVRRNALRLGSGFIDIIAMAKQL